MGKRPGGGPPTCTASRGGVPGRVASISEPLHPGQWSTPGGRDSVLPREPFLPLKRPPPLGQNQGRTYRFYDRKSPTLGLLGRRREKGKNVILHSQNDLLHQRKE